jgi:hydroxymethylpyrimidine kinase/phosphomethylpyrimidine kinase
MRRGSAVPVALAVAGFDTSGGAGLPADLKTFAAFGVHGAGAVTCVVAEHPGRVARITPLSPARVAEQITTVREAFLPGAIKTGMLYSAGIIRAVEKAMGPMLAAGVLLVIDPVMTASAGGTLLQRDALAALRKLMARATLITPNRRELAALTGRRIGNLTQLEAAARELQASLGGVAILAKGGHFTGREAVDILVTPDGRVRRFAAKRIPGVDPHGTGCTYASAIAAGLARGLPLPQAVAAGKRFITRAIRERRRIGGYELLNQ